MSYKQLSFASFTFTKENQSHTLSATALPDGKYLIKFSDLIAPADPTPKSNYKGRNFSKDIPELSHFTERNSEGYIVSAEQLNSVNVYFVISKRSSDRDIARYADALLSYTQQKFPLVTAYSSAQTSERMETLYRREVLANAEIPVGDMLYAFKFYQPKPITQDKSFNDGLAEVLKSLGLN